MYLSLIEWRSRQKNNWGGGGGRKKKIGGVWYVLSRVKKTKLTAVFILLFQTCDKCKHKQKCTKKFLIQRFPPILVLRILYKIMLIFFISPFSFLISHLSLVTCHLSLVTCHLSLVTSHLSPRSLVR